MTARTRLIVSAAAAALLLAPAAQAQDDKRLRDLEKQVRELRAIVFQGRDTGQPVVVKPEGPDPQVTALQTRADTQDGQIRDLTGKLEVVGHDLDEARRANEQLKADAATQRQALSDRLAKLEAELAGPAPAPAPAATPDAGPPPPPSADAGPRPRGSEITARVQAQDSGRLGGGAPAPEAAPATAPDSFEGAYASYQSGDYASAAGGFQAYVATHPTGARTAEARYFVGQSLYARATYPEAARAYAEALRGWPKTAWAPDATVKLAQALVQLDRSPSACQALAEYGRRYAGSAPVAVKVRATATRARAQCAGG